MISEEYVRRDRGPGRGGAAAGMRLAAAAALLSAAGIGCRSEPVGSMEADMATPAPRPDGTGGVDLSMPRPAAPEWRWESPQPMGNNFRGVWGVAGASAAEDELFVVGDGGTLLHYDRSGWQAVSAPNSLGVYDTLAGVSGSGSGPDRDVLAIGGFDKIMLRDGGRWTELNPIIGNGDSALTALWGSSVPGEYYAVGTGGRIFHVHGATVFQHEAQGLVTQYLAGVAGRGTGSGEEVYAVGASGKVLHKQAGKWGLEAMGTTVQQLNAVTVMGDGDVYAVGDGGTVLHRHLAMWAVEPAPATVNLNGVWGHGDEVYAVGNRGTVLRRSSSMWKVEAEGLTTELLSAVWGAVHGSEATVYAVGNVGTVLRRQGGTWAALSTRITERSLSSVWARNGGEVYAVGGAGTILRRSGTKERGAWAPEGEGVTTETLNAVAGWAAAMDGPAEVYAVGSSGTILHRTDKGWVIEGAVLTGEELTAVWVGAADVFAVGRSGRIAHKQNGRWSLIRGVIDTDLLSVWGTGQGGALVVYASGVGGALLRYSAGGFQREGMGVTDQSLTSVFGRSSEEVYALGTKAVALHRLGGKWYPDSLQSPLRMLGGTAVTGCAVPRSDNLFAIATLGRILRRADGTWGTDGPGLTMHELAAISAAALDDVYAIGSEGIVLHRY